VQAQVDWGHLGYLEDESEKRPVSGVVFTPAWDYPLFTGS